MTFVNGSRAEQYFMFHAVSAIRVQQGQGEVELGQILIHSVESEVYF